MTKQPSKKLCKIADLYIDQYGNHYHAQSLKALREQLSGKVSKMYTDTKSGDINHVGYVIGQHWLTAYSRVQVKID